MLPRAVVALLVAPVLAVAACSTHSTVSAPGGEGYLATNGHGGLLAKRQNAPDLAGQTLAGATLSTAALRGKVVVINFYASWCAPCRAETPLLEAAALSQAARGVDVVGVLFKDSPTNGIAFRKTYHVSFPSLVDEDGVDLAKFRNVNPSAIPVTFVLDRKGTIAARYVGGLTALLQPGFARVLATLEAEPA